MKPSDQTEVLIQVEGNLYPVFWEFPHMSEDWAAKSKAAYIVNYAGEARLVLKEQGYLFFCPRASLSLHFNIIQSLYDALSISRPQ